MATTNSDTVDSDLNCTAAVTDCRALDVGDRIHVDGRSNPLTVQATLTREPGLVDGTVTQHGVRVAGECANAVSIELHNEWHVRGERTGAVVDERGRERDVWRVVDE